MKIYDEALENELETVDLEKGYLKIAQRLVQHHPEQQREIHYEVMEGTVTEDFPNGLRQEIVDKEYSAAWDEYEDVQRFIPYTEAELAEMAKKKAAEEAKRAEQEAAMKKATEEAAKAAIEQAEKIARIDAIDAQVTYTAMMTDTLMVKENA